MQIILRRKSNVFFYINIRPPSLSFISPFLYLSMYLSIFHLSIYLHIYIIYPVSPSQVIRIKAFLPLLTISCIIPCIWSFTYPNLIPCIVHIYIYILALPLPTRFDTHTFLQVRVYRAQVASLKQELDRLRDILSRYVGKVEGVTIKKQIIINISLKGRVCAS